MDITNQTTINEWSNFSDEDLNNFGIDGDDARKNLLDQHILRLLGPVSDKQILDAGCGNGYMCRKLASMGAIVTGLEPSTSLFEYCTRQEELKPCGIIYIQQDITQLDLEPSFDAVVLINVLMDIPDYRLAMKNCIESIKSGGLLVFSILHPAFPGFQDEWDKTGTVAISEYFNAVPLKQKYGHLHTRPIQDYLNNIIQLGCSIEEVVEPQSKDEEIDSRNYHVPQFLIIKAIKK